MERLKMPIQTAYKVGYLQHQIGIHQAFRERPIIITNQNHQKGKQ